jgi:hypothetical protein
MRSLLERLPRDHYLLHGAYFSSSKLVLLFVISDIILVIALMVLIKL